MTEATAQAASTATRPSFAYLDGLRGLAALAVALYHAFLYSGTTGEARAELPILSLTIGQGYLGVAVFIVLSGYVLMLPIVKSPGLVYRHGAADFLKRRSWRILPPYYAALIFSLALILAAPIMQTHADTQWDTKVPVTVGSVVSHLTLIHNLSPSWYGKINGPLWSVALEYQIYLLMPLVLLPLWRRVSPLVAVPLLAVVCLLPMAFGIGAYLHPHLVVLFALGMVSAQLTLGGLSLGRPVVLSLVALAGISAATCAVMVVRGTLFAAWLMDLWAGVGMCVLMVWFGRRKIAGRPVAASRWLETKPVMFLGLISYSVYLVHSPILGLGNLLLLDVDMPLPVRYLVMTFVILPIALIGCAGFYWLVERRFKNSRQRQIAREIRD